jgi:hypothetical protein
MSFLEVLMQQTLLGALLSIVTVGLLSGCAEKGPVLLRNIAYQAPENTAAGSPKAVVGVSPFKDLRGGAASVLGKRTIRNDIENDLVVQGAVADLVTTALKDALKVRGVVVKDAPAWDLKAETVAGEGFDILVGGEIKALWIEVESQPFNVKQQAVVQLRVSAADRASKAVFKTLSMNSKMDRQDIAFSFDTVEGLLSEALTAAIDQLLKDDEFKKKIH